MTNDDYPPIAATHLDVADQLAVAFRATAAVGELVRPLGTVTASEAVVVGIGDDPWADGSFSIEELEEIGCRIQIVPAAEEWHTAYLSGEVSRRADETFGYEVYINRQVMNVEAESIDRNVLYRWFWSVCAALPAQVFAAAAGCTMLQSIEGVIEPSWTNAAQSAGQGLTLFASYRMTAGDSER